MTTDTSKSLLDQWVAVDKAMEAILPLVQASADSGVSAEVCQHALHAYQILDKAYCALGRQRDAEMKRKWQAGK